MDLSSPAHRTECCKLFGKLCSGCMTRSVVDDGIKWGDNLKEVILDRGSLSGLEFVTLSYESDREFQFFERLLGNANWRGQCNDCRVEVEMECRQPHRCKLDSLGSVDLSALSTI